MKISGKIKGNTNARKAFFIRLALWLGLHDDAKRIANKRVK